MENIYWRDKSGRWNINAVETKPNWIVRAVGAVVLVVLVWLVYGSAPYTGLEGDSRPLVLEDTRIREVNHANLSLIFKQEYWYGQFNGGVYRPLATLSYLFNYAVVNEGTVPWGYHVLNVWLHALNVILVWLIAMNIWKLPLPGLFTAVLFAVHPVNVEAVTNVAGRPDLMAAGAVLAGLLLHSTALDRVWPRRAAVLGIFIAMLLGVFSKENASILPAAMLVYDAAFRRPLRARSRRLLPAYLATAAVFAVMLVARYRVFADLRSMELRFVDNPLLGAGFFQAHLTALQVILRDVWLLVWPGSLSYDYSYNAIPLVSAASGVVAVAGVAALLFLVIWQYRRSPECFFFGAFFFVTLLPTSNLLFLTGTIMAERFLYLPSIGFAGCLVGAVFALHKRMLGASTIPVAVSAALCLAVTGLGVRTGFRNLDWTDDQHLWNSAVAARPDSFKPHIQLVYAWARDGLDIKNVDLAIAEAEEGVAILKNLTPEQSASFPLRTLGMLYRIKGDLTPRDQSEEIASLYGKAAQVLESAVPVDEAYAQARRRAELERGRPADQIPEVGDVYLYQEMVQVYRRLTRFPEALAAASKVVRLLPLAPGVYDDVWELNQTLGKPEPGIIALWQSYEIEKTPEMEGRLLLAYEKTYPNSCAETGPGTGKLNLGCPLVKAHLCSAHQTLARVLEETGNARQAAPFRRAAIEEYGCAP